MNVKHPYRSSLKMAVILLLSTWLAGCGINTIPTLDEQVKAAWAQVQNQYQRRTDLIPNLMEVVKGYAKHEEATLTAVTEAEPRPPRFRSMPRPSTIRKNSNSSNRLRINCPVR